MGVILTDLRDFLSFHTHITSRNAIVGLASPDGYNDDWSVLAAGLWLHDLNDITISSYGPALEHQRRIIE